MRKLTTAEVARMTGMQVESMNDDAVLYHHSTAQDSLGQVIDTFDSGNLVTCGITTNKEHRNERGEVVTIDADAIMRLAVSEAIAVGDKVVHKTSASTASADWIVYDDDDSIIALIGQWISSNYAPSYGGSHSVLLDTLTPLGAFQFTAEMKQFRIGHYVSPSTSSVNIFVDGALLENVDFATGTAWDLVDYLSPAIPAGWHTIRVELVTGSIYFDRLDILPPDVITTTGKAYIVDGVQAGRNVNIIPLMEIKI